MASMLKDPRDLPLLRFGVRAMFLLPLGVAVFAAHPLGTGPFVAAAVAFVAFYVFNLEPFITMFHDVNHRPLFGGRWRGLNRVVYGLLGPMYGSTPATYFGHHVLMHHPEENGPEDASSTLAYRRDSKRDFARYYARFVVSLVGTSGFLARRYPNKPFARRLIAGELGWWMFVAVMMIVDPLASLVVLVLPVVVTRSLLVIGNWGEHAFIDPDDPLNPYKSGTELIGESVNRRAFNVGYHISHHLRPAAHYSTHPVFFEHNQRTYAEHDAVVLRDLNYPQLWWRLMRKDYARIAAHWVQLPGAPERSEAEVIALLKRRVEPIGVQA